MCTESYEARRLDLQYELEHTALPVPSEAPLALRASNALGPALSDDLVLSSITSLYTNDLSSLSIFFLVPRCMIPGYERGNRRLM